MPHSAHIENQQRPLCSDKWRARLMPLLMASYLAGEFDPQCHYCEPGPLLRDAVECVSVKWGLWTRCYTAAGSRDRVPVTVTASGWVWPFTHISTAVPFRLCSSDTPCYSQTEKRPGHVEVYLRKAVNH